MQDFKIKTEKFEGPLDLLLDLIEKKKLHISEVALREVADGFLAYVERHQPFPLESASQFILVASTLILIKSKSLLPYLELEKEEEEGIGELELRLKIYQALKEVSEDIQAIYGKKIIFPLNPPQRRQVFSPGGITLEGIIESAEGLLRELPVPKAHDEVRVRATVSLEEMIESLHSRIERALKLSFKEFSGLEKAERVDVIVSFLAMLELVKQGLIRAEQEGKFGDILMESESVGVPKYD